MGHIRIFVGQERYAKVRALCVPDRGHDGMPLDKAICRKQDDIKSRNTDLM
jgi:hypothetical protein